MPNDDPYLRGKHAIVTGGSRGIGAAIAAELARAGADLTILARSTARLDQQAERLRALGAQVTALECDIAEEASVRACFARARDERGDAYVLVNNAGMAEAAPFGATSRELWDRTLAVNLTGVFTCTQQVLPAMLRARAGRVVNVASTAGLRGYKTMSAYCASKHGVVGLTRALAAETAKHGVTVNAVCPGYVATDMTEHAVSNVVRALGKSEEDARAMIVGTVPRGSLITPEEVASAVLWLCRPEAGAVSGVALPIAGGEMP
ncbi:SDR family NAD(P)-dependent oxidoreductase [Gemmatirosa kalamazoonensis]|nr:SDR family NAD(P)-dependent oxidoreductase [Gemmatirosa kalamazoonensis]